MAILAKREISVGSVGDPPLLVANKDGRFTDVQVGLLNDWLKELARVVNGGLRIGPDGPSYYQGASPAGVRNPNGCQAGNLSAQIRVFYFAAARVDTVVPHNIGRVPLGVLLLDCDVDGGLLRGSQQADWTDRQLILRAGQIGTYAFVVV